MSCMAKRIDKFVNINSLSQPFSNVRLYLEDLEDIINLLKENDFTVRITCGEHNYSPDEIETLKADNGTVIKKCDIIGDNTKKDLRREFSLRCPTLPGNPESTRLHLCTDNCSIIFEKVKSILTKRRESILYRSINKFNNNKFISFIIISLLCLIVLIPLHPNLPTLTIVTFFVFLFILMQVVWMCSSYFETRLTKPTFVLMKSGIFKEQRKKIIWERQKFFINSLISGIGGGVIVEIIHHLWK